MKHRADLKYKGLPMFPNKTIFEESNYLDKYSLCVGSGEEKRFKNLLRWLKILLFCKRQLANESLGELRVSTVNKVIISMDCNERDT